MVGAVGGVSFSGSMVGRVNGSSSTIAIAAVRSRHTCSDHQGLMMLVALSVLGLCIRAVGRC